MTRRKALIVEDQSDLRQLILLTLEYEDYDLHQAQDGAQGWQLAQSLRPDIVLLDVMMPGELDGYQLCERIKRDPQLAANCKVILLTARGQRSDIEQGRAAGCDAYLTKPFSPLELLETMEQLAGPSPS